MPTNPSHHHELSLITGNDSRYTCAGCKMHGRGDRYRCDELCHYDLHKDCMHPNPTRIIESLYGSAFMFLYRPPPRQSKCCRNNSCDCGRVCDLCAKTIEGFVYHCSETGLDVHPLCANLKRKISVDDIDFKLYKGVPSSNCNWCKRKILKGSEKNVPGFYYVSGGSGDVCFHVYCLMEMGYKHGSSVGVDGSCGTSNDGNNVCAYKDYDNNAYAKMLAIPERRLQKKSSRGRGVIGNLGKVVGLFLKIVLSVLFGDPTMILASVVVHLLKP